MGFDWIPRKQYKRHYICLSCKKGFKRPSAQEMKQSEATDFSNLMNDFYSLGQKEDIINYIDNLYKKTRAICPNCKSVMIQVHYNFEVPAQRDNKSWKLLHQTMLTKTTIQYDSYLQWHRQELKKVDSNTEMFNQLMQNLAKLEKVSKN